MSADDQRYMRRALELAQRAEALGEVPVGAVLVEGEEILAEAWNCPIASHDPTAHAEILALRAAGEQKKNYRLVNTTLYVTLEPCGMCALALIHARVARVVFGAADPKTGALGGAYDLFSVSNHNHLPEVLGGVLVERCAEQLQQFFRQRR
ncbi:MAG: tRNA adenosine(34) deaminase TadA [Gammaproteobacteria bacterium]|nr:tRNA adenosine(34) deaminase TadA [Gammaproteobacteria bacterium]